MLLTACGGTLGASRGAPGSYAQTVDSATNACARNPACYLQPSGEQAILPWVSNAARTVEGTVAVLRLLDAMAIARVEQILTECAEQASFEVNERMLGPGKRPTRELCQKVVGKDSRGQEVTLAMELGREKHRVARECARERLGREVPDNFSQEPYYQYDRQTGQTRWLDPKLVEEWKRQGLFDQLRGTLSPDVVLHASGNPLQVQAVYDFKFPCPASNSPRWNNYPSHHPHHPANQGELYQEALGGATPARVAPAYEIIR
jgi:hypothetical protein